MTEKTDANLSAQFIVRRPFALVLGWWSYKQIDGFWGADVLKAKIYGTHAEAADVLKPTIEGEVVTALEALDSERQRVDRALDCMEMAEHLSHCEHEEREVLTLRRVSLDALLPPRAPWKGLAASEIPPLKPPSGQPFGAPCLARYRSDADRARNEPITTEEGDQP